MFKNLPKLLGPTKIAAARKHQQKMLRRIKQARTSKQQKLLRRLIVEYLQSTDAKVLAVLEAYRAMAWSARPPKKSLPGIALSLNPWQPSDEPVLVDIKPKGPSINN
jgi:hypothetical protein